jgi:hypothetical protein
LIAGEAVLTPTIAKNMTEAMRELANIGLVVFLVFIAMMIVVSIASMRDKAMRKILRKRREKELEETGEADLTTVLPQLNRNELTNFALEEKKKSEELGEQISFEKIDGLPLKPRVYFDPVKDAAKPDDPQPEPKIIHSFLSTDPLPREEKAEEEKKVVEEKKTVTSPWMPVDITKKGEESEEDVGEDEKDAH